MKEWKEILDFTQQTGFHPFHSLVKMYHHQMMHPDPKSPTKKSLGQRYCHVYREGELEELPPGELFLMGKHPPSFFPTKNGPEEVCENRGPGTPPCFFFFFRIEAMMGRFLAFFRNFSDGFKNTLALCDFLPTPQKWWTLEVQFFARKENTCKNF